MRGEPSLPIFTYRDMGPREIKKPTQDSQIERISWYSNLTLTFMDSKCTTPLSTDTQLGEVRKPGWGEVVKVFEQQRSLYFILQAIWLIMLSYPNAYRYAWTNGLAISDSPTKSSSVCLTFK